ncbi:MAG: FAD-dependent oxidoreductase, partial [Chthoniobacterales bacterium]
SSPLSPLAKKFGIRTVWTPFADIALRGPDGVPFTDAQTEALLEDFSLVLSVLEGIARARFESGQPDISMEAGITAALDMITFTPQQRARMEFYCGVFFGELRSAMLSDLSLYYTDTDKNLGVQDRAFSNGYVQLVHALARGIDIRFGHIVRGIAHNNRGVRVETNRGSFEGQYCVVTLPLGVLKTKQVQFSPPLPASKRQAIARLNMGTDNKVYLRFPKVFWERGATFVMRQRNEPGQWGVWVNARKWTDQPIFMALLGGEYAIRCEDFSDERIVSEGMSVLRGTYGKNIPDPEAVLRSRWYSDPFCHGAYSHIPPGATPDDYEILSRPVARRLFFAGEATISAYRSSVRGAYVTGRREAARILKLRRG